MALVALFTFLQLSQMASVIEDIWISYLLLHSICCDFLFWLKYPKKKNHSFTKAHLWKGGNIVLLWMFFNATPKLGSGRSLKYSCTVESKYLWWAFHTLYTPIRMRVKKANNLVNPVKGSWGPPRVLEPHFEICWVGLSTWVQFPFPLLPVCVSLERSLCLSMPVSSSIKW